jgi:hypothetical protein
VKERYRELWQSVNRPGVAEFLDWLDKTDFYTAPCSTKHHLAREGGLLEHSLNVYNLLSSKVFGSELYRQHNPDSIAICALGHDICKADFYGQEMRNVKENGNWVQKPFYMVKDKLPYGHGEKSVLLLQRFIGLTTEEVMAVRWHMAGFTPGITDYSISQAFSEAASRYPLVILLHMADMEATYLKENTEVTTDGK